MSSFIAQLKEENLSLYNENEMLRSMLKSFWTGDVPSNATLDHMVLAKWGRKRLDEKAKVPALLVAK